MLFATYQEAVRKDIEQAFSVIIKNLDILSRSIWFWRKDVIINLLHTCIIFHYMTVNNDEKTMSVNKCFTMTRPLIQWKKTRSHFLEALR